LKPIDDEALARAVAGPRHVFFIAEHVEAGRPGEMAAGLFSGLLAPDVALHGLCLAPEALKTVGGRDHILAQSGLHAEGIAARVRRAVA